MLFRWDPPLFFANAELFHQRVLDALRTRRRRCGGSRCRRTGHQHRRDFGDMLAELEQTLRASSIELRFAEMKDPVKDKLKRFQPSRISVDRAPSNLAAVDAYLEEHPWIGNREQKRRQSGVTFFELSRHPYNPQEFSPVPGTRLGVYEVAAQIGEGGMATCRRRCRDGPFGRPCDVAVEAMTFASPKSSTLARPSRGRGVCGFEIAVQDPFLVRDIQGLGNLQRQSYRLADESSPASGVP